jgi:hypothetical protein
MKSIFKLLLVVGLGILVYVLLTGKVESCQQTPQGSDTTIVHDTAWNIKVEKYPVYKPGPTVTLPGDTQWLSQPIDTMKLLRDYYAKRVYFDTIWIDSFGFVAWLDTVNKNTVSARQKEKNYKIPTITKTVTINNYYTQSRQLNVTAAVNPTRGILYGGVSYEDRKDRIYHVSTGYGFGGFGGVVIGYSMPLWKESAILKKLSK